MENGSPIIQPGKLNVVHEHRPGQNSTSAAVTIQQQDGSLKVITIGGQPVIPMVVQVAAQVAGGCVPLATWADPTFADQVATAAIDIAESIIGQYTERVIAFQQSQQEAQAAEQAKQSPIITPPE